MNDTPRPALVAASWFSLLVAVLAMSVPYMEFISGARAVETMGKELDAELPPSAAVFRLPQWSAATVLVVLMLALVVKELALGDAAAKVAINVSLAVLLLVAGAWFALLVRAATAYLHDPLAPLGAGPM